MVQNLLVWIDKGSMYITLIHILRGKGVLMSDIMVLYGGSYLREKLLRT